MEDYETLEDSIPLQKKMVTENDHPVIPITEDEFEDWCKPWKTSLILKLQGNNKVTLDTLKTQLQHNLSLKGTMKINYMTHGYFIVSFSEEEDYNRALFQGPWKVQDHYLIVQRWRPFFMSNDGDAVTKVAVWVKIHCLPIELHNQTFLSRVGAKIGGAVLRIDSGTGKFARICVEVDLGRRLVSMIRVLGFELSLEYEGLCFKCGQYDHEVKHCEVGCGLEESSSEKRGPDMSVATTREYHRVQSNEQSMKERAASFKQNSLISSPFPQASLQNMHKADNFEVNKLLLKQRLLKAVLNKLTPQNIGKILQQIQAVNIDNVVTLSGFISQIYEKALMEPTLCEMYVNLCFHLAAMLPDFSEDNERITFKRLLLNMCQEEFERGEREREEANKADEGDVKLFDEERDEKQTKSRRRKLGNIRLIGELYKNRMLTERIIHECTRKLLGQHQDPDEEDIEALCVLMSTVGEMIDRPTAKQHMDAYFERISFLGNNMNLSSRVRLMLKDVIDLRKNKWAQKKVEGQEKTEEVHIYASNQRQAQAGWFGLGLGKNPSRRIPTDFDSIGSSGLSFRNAQMGELHGLATQVCGGYQDACMDGSGNNMKYGSRDLKNEGRVLDTPVVTSPPAQTQRTTVSQKSYSDEKLQDMSKAAIREYYSARDEKEVILCIKDLNSPSFHPSMVSLWVRDSFERTDIERDLLAQLLANLVKSKDSTLSQAQLNEGFKSVLSTLEDAVKDAPKAAEFLGRIFAKAITEHVVSLKDIGQLIQKGGEEPGNLLEAGLAANVLGSTLDVIKMENGDAVLSEIRASSNLWLDPLGSMVLEKFI
ncbi:hypothetical protein RJT34_16109 [Clitoria ternatea]|uniref:Eukaryotic translation initiation factor 4G n=1 Tax=Clitoria ternatea TaxID=43366 RepID=A0AAN9J7V5_CLITE